MIVDRLNHYKRYECIHPGFATAFEFLRRDDLAQLPDGRHEVQGDQLFVMIARLAGRGRQKSLLEYHRTYIDIQLVLEGTDCIGWMPTEVCMRVSSPYDAEKDIGFFFDRPDTWVTVPSASFAILYPEDAHAPLATEGHIHKAIMKVALES